MRFIKLALLIVFLYVLIVAVFIKLGHGHEWIVQNNYRNVNGTLCCDETDCGYITNEQAWTAGIGSTVEVEIKGVKYNVVINSVFPSWDQQGRAVACTTGCLFRTSGY